MMSVLVRAVLLFNFLLLSACQNGVEDKNQANNNASNFEVVNITPINTEVLPSNKAWPDLRDTVTLGLRACIQDRTFQQPIVGDSFTIYSDVSTSKATSTGDGCIDWTEKFKFEYTADETFYKIKGEIVNEDNFFGNFYFELAVNPWTREVRYLNKEKSLPSKMISVKSQTKSTLPKNFNTDTYQVIATDYNFRDGQAWLELKVMTRPTLSRVLIDGRPRNDEFLTGGEFNLSFDLFQRVKGERIRGHVAHTSSDAPVKVNDKGFIETTIEFDISKPIDKEADLELMINVVPNLEDKSIGVVKGYVEIDTLVAPNTGSLLELPNTLDNLMIQSKLFNQKQQKTIANFTGHGVLIDEVTAPPGLEVGGNMDKSSMKNTVSAGIHLSLVDTLVFKGVNSTFHVELKDLTTGNILYSDEVETKRRKSVGKLIFEAEISYDEDYEFDYRKHRITITGVTGSFEGTKATRDVWINPRVNGSNYIRDAKDYKKPSVGLARDGGEADNSPKIYFNDVGVTFIRTEEDLDSGNFFRVNKNLDLHSERVIEIELHPKKLIGHNFNGRNSGLDPFITGSFNVGIMVYTPKNAKAQTFNRTLDLNDFYLLTSDKVNNVTLDNGLLRTQLNLPHLFSTKKMMAYKNLVVVYVESANKKSKIRPGHLIGTIDIFEPFSRVTPYMDSRLKSAREIKLQQQNEDIISEMNEFLNKKVDLLEKDENISDRYKEFKRIVQLPSTQKNVEVFDVTSHEIKKAKTEYLVFDRIQDFKPKFGEKVPQKTLESVVNNSKSVTPKQLQKLCRLFYDPKEVRKYLQKNGDYTTGSIMKSVGDLHNECMDNPEKFIELHEYNFIERITKQPAQLQKDTGLPVIKESPRKLSLSEAQFMITGTQFQEADGARELYGNILGGGVHKFFGMAEFGRRWGQFTQSQEVEMYAHQDRNTSNSIAKLDISIIDVKFEAEYKKCTYIKPKYANIEKPKEVVGDIIDKFVMTVFNSIFREKPDTSITMTSKYRYILCREHSVTNVRTETWYFATLSKRFGAGDIDATLARNTESEVFRGRKTYNYFRTSNFEKENERIIMERNLDENHDKDAPTWNGIPLKTYMNLKERHEAYVKRNGKGLKYEQRLTRDIPGLHIPMDDDFTKVIY